jgi:hypothetical protein
VDGAAWRVPRVPVSHLGLLSLSFSCAPCVLGNRSTRLRYHSILSFHHSLKITQPDDIFTLYCPVFAKLQPAPFKASRQRPLRFLAPTEAPHA